MTTLGLIFSLSMLAQADGTSAAQKQPDPAPASSAVDTDRALAEYNAQRDKVGNSAAAHWRLALWCEKNGLKPEARIHFSEVARLDPKRDAAWRKIGFKKIGGRWTTDEMIAEEKAQKAADKSWGPKLRKLHKDVHGANGPERQASVQAELDAIRDERAVVPLYREFGRGKLDQSLLIQVLDQIERPMATKMVAFLAVYGTAPEVRKQATLVLRSRPVGDYLDLLVGLMVDPLNFEIQHIGGPGSPGVIMVEGERFNSARFYAPPAAPEVTPLPGDIITVDASGQPAILRPVWSSLTGLSTKGIPGSKTLVQETARETTEYAAISPAQLQREAQRGAVSAEAQLRADEREIRMINSSRRHFNDLVMAAARDASGQDFGTTPIEWREGLFGGNKQSPKTSPSAKPIVPELVPLTYNPWFGPTGFFTQSIVRTRVFEDS